MKAYGKVTPDDQASASMLPAILGISDYSTPNDSLQTCIRAIDGLEREDITNESMTWGNDFESRILIRAAERLGLDNLELDHSEPYCHKLLKLGDKFVWLIDADRKAIAIQHDGSGNCSIGYDNKNTRKRFRMHVPKDVAEFLRKEWGVGHDDRTHSFHVQMILSSGVIEIRRTTNDAT